MIGSNANVKLEKTIFVLLYILSQSFLYSGRAVFMRHVRSPGSSRQDEVSLVR